MRQILPKKMTTALIAGALVVGVGALAGVATASGSDDPAPASRPSVDDSVGNTVGSVPSTGVTSPTGVTTPTVGVTTPTLDDDGFDDDGFDDRGRHGHDDDGADDDSSGPGSGDDDRSGSNSGPG